MRRLFNFDLVVQSARDVFVSRGLSSNVMECIPLCDQIVNNAHRSLYYILFNGGAKTSKLMKVGTDPSDATIMFGKNSLRIQTPGNIRGNVI